MDDQELRQMIREAIARHGGGALAQGAGPTVPHAAVSFARFPLLRSGDDDGACVIEPSVRCNHCGYCVSYGH